MFKKFAISMFLGLAMVFGGVATVAPQTVSAYQGETEDQFVTRIFYANWMEITTGTCMPYSRDMVEIPEIMTCDPVGESAKFVIRSVSDPSFVRYAFVFTNGQGGYGMMIFDDRAMTNNVLNLVRMDF